VCWPQAFLLGRALLPQVRLALSAFDIFWCLVSALSDSLLPQVGLLSVSALAWLAAWSVRVRCCQD
jgi:hypothetical protein